MLIQPRFWIKNAPQTIYQFKFTNILSQNRRKQSWYLLQQIQKLGFINFELDELRYRGRKVPDEIFEEILSHILLSFKNSRLIHLDFIQQDNDFV